MMETIRWNNYFHKLFNEELRTIWGSIRLNLMDQFKVGTLNIIVKLW